MSTTAKSTGLFDVPAMSSEESPELEIATTPIRISGFVALAFGLLSFTAVLGETLVIIPVLAIAIGLYALRPYSGDRPLGSRAATIGIFVAAMFLVWGVTERRLKYNQMSAQATRFAQDWLAVVAEGNRELAMELQLYPGRRQPASVPLKDYYERSEAGQQAIKMLREQETLPKLLELGKRPKWALKMPPKVYTLFGREFTETVWVDESGTFTSPIKLQLEYLPAGGEIENAHWRVETIGIYVGEKPITV